MAKRIKMADRIRQAGENEQKKIQKSLKKEKEKQKNKQELEAKDIPLTSGLCVRSLRAHRCPHCGSSVNSGYGTCHSCNKDMVWASASFDRPQTKHRLTGPCLPGQEHEARRVLDRWTTEEHQNNTNSGGNAEGCATSLFFLLFLFAMFACFLGIPYLTA